MVKIKQKKTMNLPQLIEHIWANNLRHKWKDSDNTSAYVQVYDDGQLVVDKCTKDSVFTVEVEEEITEDTKFKHLIEIEQDDTCYMWLNTSVSAEKQVNDCKNLSKEFHAYIDGEFKLIWTREKGLVE